MTPERIADLRSLYDPKHAPFGSTRGFEVVQECLDEIEHLSAPKPQTEWRPPKMVSIQKMPDDPAWQGVLLGLGEDGSLWEPTGGFWKLYHPADFQQPAPPVEGTKEDRK